ncbi:MAG: imidazole glycerol phosphate synthase subunit HisH [Lutibacter sp.]
MKICIIDYGMGNIKSVSNAIEHLNKKADLISDPSLIDNYDIIILPGVGAFKRAMEVLNERKLDIAIIKAAKEGKRIIGFCLGMQLLFSSSKEFGNSEGLNLIEGEVLPFNNEINLRIPHMGWNTAYSHRDDFKDLEGDYYYVHSFYCKPSNENEILFKTDYGIDFCSAVIKNNQIFGFQFHPEKSQKNGLKLLKKVLELC